jgi:hypothetical protein
LNHLQWIFTISCETRCDRKTNKRQTKKNDDKNVAIILKIKEITALDPQKVRMPNKIEQTISTRTSETKKGKLFCGKDVFCYF